MCFYHVTPPHIMPPHHATPFHSQVRAAFYTAFSGVCPSLGPEGVAAIVLPFLDRLVGDPDAAVVAEAVAFLARIAAGGLLRKRHLLLVAGRLCGRGMLAPGASTPVRVAAVDFLAAAAGQLSAADVHAQLLPLVLPHLVAEPLSLKVRVGRLAGDKAGLLDGCRGSVSEYPGLSCSSSRQPHNHPGFPLPPTNDINQPTTGPTADHAGAQGRGQRQQQGWRRSACAPPQPSARGPRAARLPATHAPAAAADAAALWLLLHGRWCCRRQEVPGLSGWRCCRQQPAGDRQCQRHGIRHRGRCHGGQPQRAAAAAPACVHLQPAGRPSLPAPWLIVPFGGTRAVGRAADRWCRRPPTSRLQLSWPAAAQQCGHRRRPPPTVGSVEPRR